MREVISRFGLSFRRVCRLTGWNRSSLQYQPQGRDDTALRERLRHWAALKPRWGAPILHDVLKAEGLVINHKRTERIYREEGCPCAVNVEKSCPPWLAFPCLRQSVPTSVGLWTSSTINSRADAASVVCR
jgi:hypothetical protein